MHCITNVLPFERIQTLNEQHMNTATKTYATIIFNGSKTWMVVDSADQCHFATTSERKAKNFLNRLLKNAGQA